MIQGEVCPCKSQNKLEDLKRFRAYSVYHKLRCSLNVS